MKVLTIVSDNRITGVEYGLKEIVDCVSPVNLQKQYAQVQLYKKNIYKNIRTRKK